MSTRFRSHTLAAWRWPFAVSLTGHTSAFAAALVFWSVPNTVAIREAGQSIRPPLELHSSPIPEGPRAEDSLRLASESPASDASQPTDPRWAEQIQRFEQQQLPAEGSSIDDDSLVSSQIRRSIEKGRNQPVDRNQEDLEKLSQRLTRVSSERAVDDISMFLKGITGSSRATLPDESQASKPIDPSTAQIHDVRKEVDENGSKRYIAVLVDAKGASAEVELEWDMGEQLYKTMRLIKSNPLLEKVYRQMVMGLVDEILRKP